MRKDCGCGHCTFDARRKLWVDGYTNNWALSPEYCQQCGRWLGVDFETGKPVTGPPGWKPDTENKEA